MYPEPEPRSGIGIADVIVWLIRHWFLVLLVIAGIYALVHESESEHPRSGYIDSGETITSQECLDRGGEVVDDVCYGAPADVPFGLTSLVTTHHGEHVCAGIVGDPYPGYGPDQLICGTGGPNIIRAGWGDDLVYGRGGDDRIAGGRGRDVIYGGRGFDVCFVTPVDRAIDCERLP